MTTTITPAATHISVRWPLPSMGADAGALPPRSRLRYGYWMPVFGGWLRNVPDESMEASWEYVRRLACRSEQIGFDLSLIAELFLNDIKGIDAPALDAWSNRSAHDVSAFTAAMQLAAAAPS